MARILIVEDSLDNMKLFQTILKLKGYEVVGLSDGSQLLATLATQPFDLVLMDIQIPGKDGYQLLREIRESQWSGYHVVALTAHAMAGDESAALEAGFDSYISKPIDLTGFATAVAKAIEQGRTT